MPNIAQISKWPWFGSYVLSTKVYQLLHVTPSNRDRADYKLVLFVFYNTKIAHVANTLLHCASSTPTEIWALMGLGFGVSNIYLFNVFCYREKGYELNETIKGKKTNQWK